jgi:hypothetical protein
MDEKDGPEPRTVDEIIAHIKRLGAEAEDFRRRAIEIEQQRAAMEERLYLARTAEPKKTE